MATIEQLLEANFNSLSKSDKVRVLLSQGRKQEADVLRAGGREAQLAKAEEKARKFEQPDATLLGSGTATVRAGETIFDVAERIYGTSFRDAFGLILQANPGLRQLRPGQTLRIPRIAGGTGGQLDSAADTGVADPSQNAGVGLSGLGNFSQASNQAVPAPATRTAPSAGRIAPPSPETFGQGVTNSITNFADNLGSLITNPPVNNTGIPTTGAQGSTTVAPQRIQAPTTASTTAPSRIPQLEDAAIKIAEAVNSPNTDTVGYPQAMSDEIRRELGYSPAEMAALGYESISSGNIRNWILDPVAVATLNGEEAEGQDALTSSGGGLPEFEFFQLRPEFIASRDRQLRAERNQLTTASYTGTSRGGQSPFFSPTSALTNWRQGFG